MSESSTDSTLGTGRARGFKRVLGGVLLAVGVGLGATAFAGGVGGHGAHGSGGPEMMFAGNPARFDRGVDRMLASVNATEAQKTQIKQIVRAAAIDLKPQHEAGRKLREQAAQLFTAPTVDANAVEATRQQMLAQHEQGSRRISQALVEISRVLTPEQRVQLAEKLKKRGERGERGERGHRHGHGPGPAASAPRTQ